MELVDRCFDWPTTTFGHRLTTRERSPFGITRDRDGLPHAVQPSARDLTSEDPKAQRPPRKLLVQYFLSQGSLGRYSKQKAKKATCLSTRRGHGRLAKFRAIQPKRLSLPVRKNSCNFRNWRYIASVFCRGFIALLDFYIDA